MEQINAIGRRKAAVARVYLTEGTGKITINKRELNPALTGKATTPAARRSREVRHQGKPLWWWLHRSVSGIASRYRTCTRKNQCRRQEGPPRCWIHHSRLTYR